MTDSDRFKRVLISGKVLLALSACAGAPGSADSPGNGGTAIDDARIAEVLQTALERQPSGDPIPFGRAGTPHAGTVTVLATSRRDDGVYCRTFEMHLADEPDKLLVGQACRVAPGAWQVSSLIAKEAAERNGRATLG